jgi:Phage integrase, N-terminal SAM-like domain
MFLPIILFKVDLLNFSNYCNIMQTPPKKLLDQVRDVIRLKYYSYRTEETYVQWIVRYILFHNKRHPKDMGVPEIEEFLTHLAVEGNVAAATQNQALNAILFLYRQSYR